MRISVIDAEEQLDDLVCRAEAGEEIILTCDGRDAIRLVPMGSQLERSLDYTAASNSNTARQASEQSLHPCAG
jgi:antitoxin (DNA-binding transcriptional repressor) of toxin-antitoxin stability system